MATPKMANTPDCMMISLRDVRVASTLGHCLWFKANEPQLVPNGMVNDAAAVGCVPVDAKEYEAYRMKLSSAAEAHEELKETLIAAIDSMVKRNTIADFTPTGHPKIPALATEAKVDVSQVTEQLRDHVFAEWRARNRNAREQKQKTQKA